MSPDNSSAALYTDSPVLSNSSSHYPANSYITNLFLTCGSSPDGSQGLLSAGVFIAVNTVVLSPLCSVVLYRGYRRWRGGRATASHSDAIAYHMAALEALGVLSGLTLGAGILLKLLPIQGVSMGLNMLVIPCRLSLHCLICVERYLAAVHPVTYLGLRGASGARARNAAIGCVWLFGVGMMGLFLGTVRQSGTIVLWALGSFDVCCLLVVVFCSVTVLRVLVRPPPGGEQREASGGGKAEAGGMNQLRRRAFLIIVVMLLVLLCNILGLLVCAVLVAASGLSHEDLCTMFLSSVWFYFPTSLVVPLMFLHRTGLTPGCMQGQSKTEE